jgi:transposase
MSGMGRRRCLRRSTFSTERCWAAACSAPAPEFIRFLNTVEASVPAGKVVHVILDNYAAHKHPRVRAWLSRHPRWIFHFTPTSASWINAVETFFSALTRRRLRRGDFRSLVDLQTAINRYIAEHNDDPRPLAWTKTDAQFARIEPHLPTDTRGKPRVDDRRVIGGYRLLAVERPGRKPFGRDGRTTRTNGEAMAPVIEQRG